MCLKKMGCGWRLDVDVWVGGWFHDNNAKLWLHFASWNLPDSLLSWESNMEPRVAMRKFTRNLWVNKFKSYICGIFHRLSSLWKFIRAQIMLFWGNFEPTKICLWKDFNLSHVWCGGTFSEFLSSVSSSTVRNRIPLVLFGANFISVYCKGCLLPVRVLTQVLE